MEVTIFISENSDLRIYTQFENSLSNYTETDILPKRLLLLPVVSDNNYSLFSKRLHTMNKIIGYW